MFKNCVDPSRPHPFIKRELDAQFVQQLAYNERDYILMTGGCFRVEDAAANDRVRFAPFFVFPSLLPRASFQLALRVQPLMNRLMMAVAHDRTFLTECLRTTITVDDFTASLFDIYTSVMDEGLAQSVSLGVLRCDYFHDTQRQSVAQVEINTIAASFAGLTHTVTQCHRYAMGQLDYEPTEEEMPENKSLVEIVHGMLHAWDYYAVAEAAILFVVEERAINLCDQRFHEFELCRQRPSVKVIRRSHKQLITAATLGARRQLIVDGVEIAVVYFRTGYTPRDYPTNDEWNVRRLIERSLAVKCPSIHLHLAGTKKVQQELTVPGVLERFLDCPQDVALCRSVFAGIYSLDNTAAGDAAAARAVAAPELYVLKPQREGGGNNVYDRQIVDELHEATRQGRRQAYVLMERLRPLVQPNYLLQPSRVPGGAEPPSQPELVDSVTELGVFGYVLGDGHSLSHNKCCGFTLRSKPESVLEGGIAAGFGAMDSPFLV